MRRDDLTFNRRQLLVGLSGLAAGLALPVLPSLLSPREAHAQATGPRKFYVHFATSHGGIWTRNMFPDPAALTEARPHADRMVRRGDLVPRAEGGAAVLSPVLTAPAGVLTAALARKLNVLQGLDIPFYIGHHTGGHLGNYARNDGNGGDGVLAQNQPRQTIDQVMAYSPSFYPTLSGVRQRAMVVGSRLSYRWSDPLNRRGVIEQVDGYHDSLDLFDAVFGTAPPGAARPRPVLARMIANARRLRDGSRRLSTEDRRRLDEHVQRLVEIDRQLNATVACAPTRPTAGTAPLLRRTDFDQAPDAQRDYYRLMNQVIVAAFACGASRIATVHAGHTFSSYAGDWHQSIAHQAHLATGEQQRTMVEAHQRFFAEVYMDLVARLDATEAPGGGTLLDRALVVWTQESGPYTHDSQSMPVIAAGSAGGALRTGSYVDYRNRALVVNRNGDGRGPEQTFGGLLWHQWLATVMNAMGIPRSEWEEPGGQGGYGLRFVARDYEAHYPDAVRQNNSDTLPLLAAG